MRKYLLLCILFVSGYATAQQWTTDLDAALRAANANNRKVLLFFSVAEHCESCDNLRKNVFEKAEFVNYAKRKYELVRLDFKEGAGAQQADVEKNLIIIEKYNKDGFFPLVVILNSSGKVIGKTGPYEGQDVTSYIRILESL